MDYNTEIENEERWSKTQRRLFKMVSTGVVDDGLNRAYDIVSTLALLANLACAFMATFDGLNAQYGSLFRWVEAVTVAFFAVDYVLRILTADILYPQLNNRVSIRKYLLSFWGIVDLLSFLPYYLPWFFPAGAVTLRMFRVARIFRLFRINAYYDSLNVIGEVLHRKRQQLLSSVFIVVILIMASSLCMYSVEHEAQPEVFKNAFTGIWWAASTLLTVGYGDIYPITAMGQFLGIIITFLGVLVVAIPTGILSAGFVEQHQRLKKLGDYGLEEHVRFIEIGLTKGDAWCDKAIRDLSIPRGVIIAIVKRGNRTLVPRGDVVLKSGDRIVMGAEAMQGMREASVTETAIRKKHPWKGKMISELDISRQTYVILIKRGNRSLIPDGKVVLMDGDIVFTYSASGSGDDDYVEDHV